MSTPIALKSLTTREAVADALHRAILAIDTNSEALLASSILDSPETTWALGDRVMRGYAEAYAVFARVGPMDTLHSISNIRVNVEEGDEVATMSAHAVAHHFRAGEGKEPAVAPYTTGGIYDMECVWVAGEGLWKIRRWEMKVMFYLGDRSVMMPRAEGEKAA